MIASAFTGVITPAQFAATYTLAGTRARASSVAILQLSIYIVGLAFAAAVGALSDLLERREASKAWPAVFW